MILTSSKRFNLKNLCPEWRKHRNKFHLRRLNKKIRQEIKKEVKTESEGWQSGNAADC